jgi:Na+-transporting NADH:ubiquinone oxidoreductase subunit NqrC
MNPWLRISLAPAALLGTPIAGHAIVYLDVAQAQQAIWGGAGMSAATVRLTPEQRRAIQEASGVRQRSDTIKAWRVSGGGWFFVDEVIGKHEFITIAVGLTAGGAVKGVEVMEYRETYGDEVRSPKWRAQFHGKTKSAPLKLDADIKNISGATLSCRHIAEGVKRLLAVQDLILRG